jgi:hypothetical protein
MFRPKSSPAKQPDRSHARPGLAVAFIALILVGGAVALHAHQCVDVTLTGSPASASAGSQISVTGTLRNCGDPAAAFEVSWILSGEGRRLVLSQKLVGADPGQTVDVGETLFLPAGLPAGSYTLSLVGVAPSTFTDSDRAPLEIL